MVDIDLSTLSKDEKLELLKKLKADIATTVAETIEKKSNYKDLVHDLHLSIKSYDYLRDDDMADYAGDCVIKTISSVLDLDYKYVFEEIFKLALEKYLMPNDALRVIAPFLDFHGYKNLTVYSRDSTVELGEIIARYPDKQLLLGMFAPKGSTGHMIGYKDRTIYDHVSGRLKPSTNLLLHLELEVRFFFMKSDL